MIVTRRVSPGDACALAAFYNARGDPSNSRDEASWFSGLRWHSEPPRLVRRAGDRRFDLVAVDGPRIVGWGFVRDLDSEAPDFGIAVADDQQGRGLGGRLMKEVMAAVRERRKKGLTLIVVKDNAVARRPYEEHGFVAGDEFVGEDTLTYVRMTADLEPEAQ